MWVLVILLLVREDMIGYIAFCAASYRLFAPSPKTFQQLIRGNVANELESSLQSTREHLHTIEALVVSGEM